MSNERYSLFAPVARLFSKRKRRKFQEKMKSKAFFAFCVFMCGFAFMTFRLIKIFVNDGAKYEQTVLAQQGYTSTVIPYRRGDILDSNGTVLATTKKVYNLILEPKNILMYEENKAITVNALKEYFGMTDGQIADYLADSESYYKVAAKKLDYEVVKPFMDYCKTDDGKKVMGVNFEEEYVRIYPNDSLACHLIGFTVSGNVGMYGVEQGYNDYLNGSNGRQYTYLNDDYNLTNTLEAPVNGYNLVTSIDANIQTIIEKVVNQYMEQEGAKNVSVLVMDPNNSNILALYNSHSFDLNNAYSMEATRYQFPDMSDEEFASYAENATDEEKIDALNKVWRNFVISDVFEPGSTYKTFTISGALEENAVTENDTFYCDGGEQKDIFYIKCHAYNKGGHGMVTLSEALENSCNDALMQIAVKEGSDTFDKYQALFGFGQRTNIDIPGEQSSSSLSTVIYHAATLNPTELATSSFGQGICVSMIELGTAFCSVVNGGYYYEPSVVQRIEDENGNVIDNLDSVMVRRTISSHVSEIMKEELFKVVEQGTGKRASVEGYLIGGKTGTAEKLPRGNGKYLISFIGFAPVDNPQVVVYVVVDEPNVEDQGNSAASSYLFADIAKELFPYLNIYKTNDNYDLDLTDAIDEETGEIYEGDVPENDVAGGQDNPYVSGHDDDTEPEDTTSPDDTTEDYTTASDDGDGYNN